MIRYLVNRVYDELERRRRADEEFRAHYRAWLEDQQERGMRWFS